MEQKNELLGRVFASKFGKKTAISLNTLFAYLFEETQDKELSTAFNIIKKHAKLPIFSTWTTPDGKENLQLKLETFTSKTGVEFIKLDSWIPTTPTTPTPPATEIVPNDDLPF